MPKGGKSVRQKALVGKRFMAEVLKRSIPWFRLKIQMNCVLQEPFVSQKHGSLKMSCIRVIVFLKQEADNMGCFWAYKYHHVEVGSCHHFQLVVWCKEVLKVFQFFVPACPQRYPRIFMGLMSHSWLNRLTSFYILVIDFRVHHNVDLIGHPRYYPPHHHTFFLPSLNKPVASRNRW